MLYPVLPGCKAQVIIQGILQIFCCSCLIGSWRWGWGVCCEAMASAHLRDWGQTSRHRQKLLITAWPTCALLFMSPHTPSTNSDFVDKLLIKMFFFQLFAQHKVFIRNLMKFIVCRKFTKIIISWQTSPLENERDKGFSILGVILKFLQIKSAGKCNVHINH